MLKQESFLHSQLSGRMALKMIAGSVLHGGPGPHFLLEDLVLYLAGQLSFKSTVNSITDNEIGKALREVENIE